MNDLKQTDLDCGTCSCARKRPLLLCGLTLSLCHIYSSSFCCFYSPTQIHGQSLHLESQMRLTPALTSSILADQSGWSSTSHSRCILMLATHHNGSQRSQDAASRSRHNTLVPETTVDLDQFCAECGNIHNLAHSRRLQ